MFKIQSFNLRSNTIGTAQAQAYSQGMLGMDLAIAAVVFGAVFILFTRDVFGI